MPEGNPENLDVAYVARLCRLTLTPDEEMRYQKQLTDILAYMKQIDDLDVADIEPMAHATEVYDVWREDKSRPGLSVEDALRNAPQEVQGQFGVVKVIE
ncbi:MAG: Asp-tRNA(Asn)/Glu-tRNA(Gln) amidotransferase subunit GatC [Verrucomicrobiota bacterium]